MHESKGRSKTIHLEMNADVSSKKYQSVSIATNIINDLVIVSALEGGAKSATAVIRWPKPHCAINY